MYNHTMKTVLITGSSRGIGAAIARRLNDDYNIIINYRNSKEKAFELLYELRETNPNVIAVKADVSKEEDVAMMFNVAEKNHYFFHVSVTQIWLKMCFGDFPK